MFQTTKLGLVGGCGHVGLPLGLAFAEQGLPTVAYDISEAAVANVHAGSPPFLEPGAEELLEKVLIDGTFTASSDPSVLSDVDVVVVVVGTPVDEHLNPDLLAVPDAVEPLLPHLRDGQLLILRSTTYPGSTDLVERLLRRHGMDIDVACCPERLAEGRALIELHSLPQLVGARSERAMTRATELFKVLTDEIVPLTPEEAELAKLFTNTWRYIKFAAANQLYMIANDHGLDFERIRRAISHNYPRAADMPSAGFAAGPCLLKDTMQLAAFNKNSFTLGHSSMLVNEGLPLYVVARMEEQLPLKDMCVGILGMAFKAESDDTRSSLSYKLRSILRAKARDVMCTDPYVRDDRLERLEDVLEHADVLVIGAPHDVYRQLAPRQPVYDIWNVFAKGVRV